MQGVGVPLNCLQYRNKNYNGLITIFFVLAGKMVLLNPVKWPTVPALTFVNSKQNHVFQVQFN